MGTPLSGPMSLLGGTQSLVLCTFGGGVPQSWPKGYPSPPGTGYTVGGTPCAVFRRRTFLFSVNFRLTIERPTPTYDLYTDYKTFEIAVF